VFLSREMPNFYSGSTPSMTCTGRGYPFRLISLEFDLCCHPDYVVDVFGTGRENTDRLVLNAPSRVSECCVPSWLIYVDDGDGFVRGVPWPQWKFLSVPAQIVRVMMSVFHDLYQF
jgi:hypothetical protein